MGVGDQYHALAGFPPGKRHGTHCTGGWVLTGVEITPPPGFDPRTVQPVASRYTS